MIQTNNQHILVVGGGIAGMMLSWHLYRSGVSFKILDEGYRSASSYQAAGLINPVTGRRFVLSWLYDQLVTYAERTYGEISDFLGVKVSREVRFVRDFSSPLEENVWLGKCGQEAYAPHIYWTRDIEIPGTVFLGGKTYGVTRGKRILSSILLDGWSDFCRQNGFWIDGRWDRPITESMPIELDGEPFDAIVFATGAARIWDQSWAHLPLIPNGGEYFIVRIPDFHTDYLLKRKEVLVPLGGEMYWFGATYDWEGVRQRPTAQGRNYLEESLKSMMFCRYEIVEHSLGIRPTVKDRRPLIGVSELQPRVYFFGGFGTKGFSLTPWWASHFISHMLRGIPLSEEVDLLRFHTR